jgi:hypothetical protein
LATAAETTDVTAERPRSAYVTATRLTTIVNCGPLPLAASARRTKMLTTAATTVAPPAGTRPDATAPMP